MVFSTPASLAQAGILQRDTVTHKVRLHHCPLLKVAHKTVSPAYHVVGREREVSCIPTVHDLCWNLPLQSLPAQFAVGVVVEDGQRARQRAQRGFELRSPSRRNSTMQGHQAPCTGIVSFHSLVRSLQEGPAVLHSALVRIGHHHAGRKPRLDPHTNVRRHLLHTRT